eukprot:TRINITY_DN122911_c0_g1_i1.p1 TRINITY_DN122911_c0_g1~~TRINITY_DN122911_c0_g1_i1.p1  ORF type:complete len:262 (+),score=51.59 TRINITY_DN122911_c0_g1_i1:96-881(+)
MAIKWKPPPGKEKVTTGTTGIIITHHDATMWGNRITKEDKVHRKPTTTFMTRNVLKGPMAPPAPPQRHSLDAARSAVALEPSQFGYDPESQKGKDFMRAVDWRCGKLGPQDRFVQSQTASQEVGWTLMRTEHLKRVESSPEELAKMLDVQQSEATQYDFLSGMVKAAAEKGRQRREKRYADQEARVQQAMEYQAEFLNKGTRGSKWFHPSEETDATFFANTFVKKTGVPMHKSNPKPDEVTLRDAKGNFCPPWKPPLKPLT